MTGISNAAGHTAEHGPLAGYRIVEIAAIGPAPFCAMLLADLGADVIRVDRARAEAVLPPSRDLVNRGRRSIELDLKHPLGLEAAHRLIESSDALIEGFRPGVMERLGLGPDVCLARNPKLIYGRMTGFGQDGPLAQGAGHDINYIALTGALHAIGRSGDRPIPPLNLVGDYGGGALFLAFGILAALLERARSGRGQVIDAAMVDGASLLMMMFHTVRASGMWSDERGANMLDGGAPFYDTYETSDGQYIAVGSLEPKFFAQLAGRIGLDRRFVAGQRDRTLWPEMRAQMTRIFASKTREEWVHALEGTDSCFTGVYSLSEVAAHPHVIARKTFVEVSGFNQPAPAPRFSRTPADVPSPPPSPGLHTEEVLREIGFGREQIKALQAANAATQPNVLDPTIRTS